jgi:hypothetical protein
MADECFTIKMSFRIIVSIFFRGVGLSPLGTAATSGLLYKPQMIDEGDYGAIGGMMIGRGNRSTRTKIIVSKCDKIDDVYDLQHGKVH